MARAGLPPIGPWRAYALRWQRRRLLARAFRARRALTPVIDRSAAIRPGALLAFIAFRDEAALLPDFLAHHRALGVDHFLAVDNGSSDGGAGLMAAAPDVSLWQTDGDYRASRFGRDWLAALRLRFGHDHWCLTLDADERLIYPYWESRSLKALTGWLAQNGRRAFPAMMLELYPEGPLGAAGPLAFYDAGNYAYRLQAPLGSLWAQGGPRARAFFANTPRRAPSLNKIPLVHWHWRYAYVNSTHQLLPRALNAVYETGGGLAPSGLLLHLKFAPGAPLRAAREKARGVHFADPAAYAGYYDALAEGAALSGPYARPWSGGWRRLEAEGLLARGGWI